MFQIRGQRRWCFRTALGLAGALAAVVGAKAQSAADKWWPGYGNGADNSRYFALTQIDKSNVTQLQVAWTYPYADAGGYPIVVRGVIYGRGRNGSLVAVDAKTGKERWVRENMTGTSTRGVMYWETRDGRDQRIIFPMNSLLQEVDAKTGKSIMSFGTSGVVDLRVGIDGRDPASIGNIQSNTPGEVFENLVIVGSATGEGYMSPPGDIRAYDVLSGKLIWTFHTVPHPGECGYDTWPKDAWKYVGGNNNWGEMTVDARFGIVYVTLGSPTYDFYGLDRIGTGLFGTSIVALDARTGKRRWHFQFVHHDLWDMDPSSAPSFTTIKVNGRNRDVVALTAKTGWLYVLDRATGEPIWPIEEEPSRRAKCLENRVGRRSRYRPNPRSTSGTRLPWMTSALTWTLRRLRRSRSVLRRRPIRASSRRSASPIRCMSPRAMAALCLVARLPNRAPAPSTSSPTTTRGSCVWSIRARIRAVAVVAARFRPIRTA